MSGDGRGRGTVEPAPRHAVADRVRAIDAALEVLAAAAARHLAASAVDAASEVAAEIAFFRARSQSLVAEFVAWCNEQADFHEQQEDRT